MPRDRDARARGAVAFTVVGAAGERRKADDGEDGEFHVAALQTLQALQRAPRTFVPSAHLGLYRAPDMPRGAWAIRCSEARSSAADP